MTNQTAQDAAGQPKLVRRASGDWLAIAPSEARLAIAITAPTSEMAEQEYRYAFKRWIEILDTRSLDVPR